MKRSADLEGPYRYRLARQWGEPVQGVSARRPTMCFVMLNPSTADDQVDDPTIRRCIGFARREGCAGLVVVNLFAWRATKPVDLPRGPEAVGPRNDEAIAAAVREATVVVAAWGASWPSPARVLHVLKLIRDNGKTPHALGVSLGMHPRHPLYLHAASPLRPYLGGA
jgi:hypothetical protein